MSALKAFMNAYTNCWSEQRCAPTVKDSATISPQQREQYFLVNSAQSQLPPSILQSPLGMPSRGHIEMYLKMQIFQLENRISILEKTIDQILNPPKIPTPLMEKPRDFRKAINNPPLWGMNR